MAIMQKREENSWFFVINVGYRPMVREIGEPERLKLKILPSSNLPGN